MLLILVLAGAQAVVIAQQVPTPVEGDFTILGFKFESGETLPELKLHYRTLGKPIKDASGVVRNAVLILHITGGPGRSFCQERLRVFSSARDNCWTPEILHRSAGWHRAQAIQAAQ
jgi:hypothetical protein